MNKKVKEKIFKKTGVSKFYPPYPSVIYRGEQWDCAAIIFGKSRIVFINDSHDENKQESMCIDDLHPDYLQILSCLYLQFYSAFISSASASTSAGLSRLANTSV